MIAIVIIVALFLVAGILLFFLPPFKEETFSIDGVTYTTTELFDIADGLNSDWEVESRKEVTDEDGTTLVSCVVINKVTKNKAVIGIRKEMGINIEIINKSGWIK